MGGSYVSLAVGERIDLDEQRGGLEHVRQVDVRVFESPDTRAHRRHAVPGVGQDVRAAAAFRPPLRAGVRAVGRLAEHSVVGEAAKTHDGSSEANSESKKPHTNFRFRRRLRVFLPEHRQFELGHELPIAAIRGVVSVEGLDAQLCSGVLPGRPGQDVEK